MRDSAVRCSKRSLVLVTEPWFARAKIRLGFGLLALLLAWAGSVWGAKGLVKIWVQQVQQSDIKAVNRKKCRRQHLENIS